LPHQALRAPAGAESLAQKAAIDPEGLGVGSDPDELRFGPAVGRDQDFLPCRGSLEELRQSCLGGPHVCDHRESRVATGDYKGKLAHPRTDKK
jgi:hypothetical protein